MMITFYNSGNFRQMIIYL